MLYCERAQIAQGDPMKASEGIPPVTACDQH